MQQILHTDKKNDDDILLGLHLKVLCWSSPRCTKMTLTPQKSYKGTLSSSFLSLWWCDMTRTWFWGSTLFCLCRTLEREELRKRYISPPVPVEGIPLVYPENGEPWIGRRIDYILYRESSISKHCQTVCAPVYFYCLLYSVFSFSLKLLLDKTNNSGNICIWTNSQIL